MVCGKGNGVKTRLPCVDTPVIILYKARGRIFDDIKNAMFFLNKKTNDEYLKLPILFYRDLAAIANTRKLKTWKIRILCSKYGIKLNG